MPSFTPEIDIDDMDINVDDFLYECSDKEINEVVEWLIDNEVISNNGKLSNVEMYKLLSKYDKMSYEDQDLIMGLVEKYKFI